MASGGGALLDWQATNVGVIRCTPTRWANARLTTSNWTTLGGSAIDWGQRQGGTLTRWTTCGGTFDTWRLAQGDAGMHSTGQFRAAGWTFNNWTTTGGSHLVKRW